MLRTLLFIPLILLTLIACNNSSTSQQESKATGMNQFAEDKKFQEAHEEPTAIDHQAQGEMIEFATPDGQKGSAYALNTALENAPYLFVIHEWYGLNDHIKREAERLFKQVGNINVMALDLYDGKVADNPDDASTYMQATTEERAEAIIKGAMAQVGKETPIATVGWCFGGGWSLKSSILAQNQAAGCVMYYGMPVETADALAPLQAEVLGIFAEQDEWITPEVVTNFETLAKANGKNVSTHQFAAEHAFANPSSPRYNEEAAQKANALALAFLKEKLATKPSN